MPNKPINFDFTADTDKYSRAVKDAAKDTETLEKAIKDVPKATDGMVDKSAKDFDRLGDDAADAGSEVGDEFKQNLGQSLASGDMSALLTDTLGGLVAGLKGPVGIAGAAVAGIAALAFNEVKKQGEELKAFTESLSGALASLYEQGIKTQDKLRQLNAFNTFLEEQSDKIQDLEDDWAATGINQDKYLAGLFQGGSALDEQRDKILDVIAATEAQATSAEGPTQESLKQNAAAQELLRYLDAQGTEQEDLTGEMQNQATASQELARQLGLADVNGDGIIDDTDRIAANLSEAERAAQGISTALLVIPREIPITLKVDKTALNEFSGGAYAISGGGRYTADFGPRTP